MVSRDTTLEFNILSRAMVVVVVQRKDARYVVYC